MRHLLLLIITLATAACSSVTYQVTKLDPNNAKTYDQGGFIYFLPKTELLITVPVTLTQTLPGQYKTDVEDYIKASGPLSSDDQDLQRHIDVLLYDLGIANPVTNPHKKHRVKLGTPVFSSVAVHDPNEVYLVSVESGQAIDTLLSMNYDSQGFLTATSAEVNNRTAELAASTIQVAGNLATGLAQFGSAEFSPDNAAPRLDRNPFIKAKEYLLAFAAAQEAKQRFLTGSGKADLSLESIKHILETLTKQEDSMRAYFQSKKVTTWSAVLVYDPCSGAKCATTPNQPLFELVVQGTNLVGIDNANASLLTPPPPAFVTKPDCSKPKAAACTNEAVGIDHDKLPTAATTVGLHTIGKADNLGFRYRVPGSITATLNRGTTTLAAQDLPVAQLGVVASLPRKPGGSKSKYALELYGPTGALKTASVESTGVSTALISSFGNAGQALIDVRAKRREVREAEDAASSEKAALTAEVELLRLRKELQELEAALLETTGDE